MLSCLFLCLDQLPTVVFFEYEICYANVRCIVKRAGMRPTRVSIKIVSFSLDFAII